MSNSPRSRFSHIGAIATLLVLAILMGFLTGCGGQAQPTATEPTAPPGDEVTEPPAPPTPEPPTNTPEPEALTFEDGTDDGLSCQTCEAASPSTLSAEVDITAASVERVEEEGECYYVFTITYGKGETLDTMFMGGVEFLEPDRMILMDFNWCFNTIAHWSFNWTYNPGQPLELSIYHVVETAWEEVVDARFQGSAEGNKIILRIPCDLLAPDFTWAVANTNMSYQCDIIGLDENRVASLPLP
jgi:hypothetical protein